MNNAVSNQWAKEFPHMPESDMPAIPADWQDSSWHNDSCPSFIVMQGADGDSNYEFARVWIAEADPALRDIHESPRFNVSFEMASLTISALSPQTIGKRFLHMSNCARH